MAPEEVTHIYPSLPTAPEVYPADGLEHADLRAMLSAWNQIRNDDAMPSRPDAILKPVRHLLKFVSLLDVLPDAADFRFRIIGDAVFPGLEENQTGKLISEHPDPGIRLRFETLMRSVLETRQPVRGRGHRFTGTQRYDYIIESLWLPFGAQGQVRQIMTMASFSHVAPQKQPAPAF